mmetsp:Transcript_22579/g.85570  ORF Transcript_22579/g.85570 Transcript_22579/m.85570 type:complete len:247 (+) Transcript_22579:3999-4739(+)
MSPALAPTSTRTPRKERLADGLGAWWLPSWATPSLTMRSCSEGSATSPEKPASWRCLACSELSLPDTKKLQAPQAASAEDSAQLADSSESATAAGTMFDGQPSGGAGLSEGSQPASPPSERSLTCWSARRAALASSRNCSEMPSFHAVRSRTLPRPRRILLPGRTNAGLSVALSASSSRSWSATFRPGSSHRPSSSSAGWPSAMASSISTRLSSSGMSKRRSFEVEALMPAKRKPKPPLSTEPCLS